MIAPVVGYDPACYRLGYEIALAVLRMIPDADLCDADYLRTFVHSPHNPMREQLFIPKELDQIIGYILSLKANDAGQW